MFENNHQQATTLYLALIIMTILLAIAFGISSIFLNQTKMMKVMGHSVLAFYAADAGIEKVLTKRAFPFSLPETDLGNGATYQVFVTAFTHPDCDADYFCIKSIGTYQETRRAIEITY